ncbi:hypothetical protein [Thioclava sp. JE_KL1]|uniref:hypothetical protein n=1 Tax=Thioclava sp. JE_KL1 TaxID=2651187 RepID=UPI00128AF932|nr:hypothetical protein [Thioclava sp. JE_KL1]MPQ96056.1 hypothetical protein [Thioclava sp. JE_KL1]
MKYLPRAFRPATLSMTFAAALLLHVQADAQNAPSAEDLRALRFYIENNDEAAVKAETRQLKLKFPNWTPPSNLADLSQIEPTTEISDIYTLISRGDIDGARKLVQQVSEKYPTWKVPAEMQNQLDLAESQAKFDRAISAEDTAAAINIASRSPELMSCNRINNIWQLAKLQVSNDNASGALAAYRQIVGTCTNTPDIIATIEKAEKVTTNQQLIGLVDLARQRFPSQATTLRGLQERLLKGRGTQATSPKAAGAEAKPSSPAKLTTPKPATRVTTATAPKRTRLPLHGDRRLNATRAAAKAGNNHACLANSANPRSIDIAYERAWCAYNLERPLEAMAYFLAASQSGLSGDAIRDAKFGLALSYLKLDMTEEAARIAAQTSYTPSQRRQVEAIILNQRGIQAYDRKEYQHAIDYFDALEEMENGLSRDLALLRGYAYLNIGDTTAARKQFETLNDVLSTTDTRKALRILYSQVP